LKQNSKLLEDLSTISTIGDRARTLEQAKSMKQTVGQGMCPFCKPQTENWKNPLIKRFGNWILKKMIFLTRIMTIIL